MASFCRPFFFNATATTEIYTLSLHDALPILVVNTHEDRQRALRISGGDRVLQFHGRGFRCGGWQIGFLVRSRLRSEEHTSELQSQSNLVCRLLLEKKKKPTAACPSYSPRSTC